MVPVSSVAHNDEDARVVGATRVGTFGSRADCSLQARRKGTARAANRIGCERGMGISLWWKVVVDDGGGSAGLIAA
jgi:hypothetical protein